jgi:hypothetical protein
MVAINYGEIKKTSDKKRTTTGAGRQFQDTPRTRINQTERSKKEEQI